jgi:hypothetical protein
MSIYGIRGPYGGGIRPEAPATTRPNATPSPTGGAQRTITQTPVAAPTPKSAAAAAPTAVPVQAPQGTDPELWSVLTQDERTYFAKLGAMGPLTYGRVLSGGSLPTQPPMARGGRLDVKA